MSKFHINKHGVPALCKAKEGNCPLGGDTGGKNHFDTQEEAQAAADKMNEGEFGIFASEPYSLSTLRENFPDLNEEETEKLKSYYDLEVATFELTDKLKSADDEYMATDEYFEETQKAKELALEKYAASREALDAIAGKYSQEDIDEYLGNDVPKQRVWAPRDPNKKSTYNFHPDITHRNFNDGIGPVISAYTGKPIKQVKEEIQELRGEGEGKLSLQEATRQYWNNSSIRTDKPIVAIDLETANPRDRSLAYDDGQLTYIIETGAIKVYPDGTTETIDFKSSIPEGFNKSHGTGFVETHGIQYDEIKNEKEFAKDEARQKEVLDFLDNSVLMAHNANFEIRQFTNSLKGFKEKMNDGNIEVLDTMNFSKFLVPESPRNTNEAFVETAGVKYEGAHRAFQDAKMTLEAFNILKSDR